jgi:preprotein translocase subunit YajC
MKKITNFILKIGDMDRRWIFIIIALVVLLPLFFPIGLPIRPTDSTQTAYDAMDNLDPGSKVLVSCEYGPSTKPEVHPMVYAVLRHLFKNGHKVYITCLWPDGQFMAEEAIEEIAEQEFNLTYGKDYVLLGFRPGNEAVVKGIVSNIRKLYSTDARGTLTDKIPMMEGINQLADFDFIFTASAGYPGTVEWVQYGADPTGVPMSTGVTSIQVNEVMPYVQSGQVKGILAGMPGAAEYEKLVGVPGIGTSGMDAQSIAHLVIVLFIIFGNVAFFIERQRQKKY